MKTCYGGYCYEHKEDREFSSILSSPIKPFLVAVAIVLTLVVATGVLNEVSLSNYLTSGFLLDFPNSDYINSGFIP